jgi:hypothetical protein
MPKNDLYTAYLKEVRPGVSSCLLLQVVPEKQV